MTSRGPGMYTQKKPIENIHIVRERDRQRFRELRAVLLLALPIGGFLLLFTWQNLEVIRLGHEVTRLQKIHKDIKDANKALQIELDRMTALQAVEKKAVALGFEPADPRAIVMVEQSPAGHASAPPASAAAPLALPDDRASATPTPNLPPPSPPSTPGAGR
ncbi:MAG TPA: hypothetical protein VEZ11_07755 [Thermoanaerobaculia bacterium]|nr:hypothetical protein [Thermoanaerobaculia bacterium]